MARLKIEISVPESHVDAVLDALHAVGAGRIGGVRHAEECRIESVCDAEQARAVQQAVREVHPYEEAVIHFLPLYEP